jgi:hypothetical protein
MTSHLRNRRCRPETAEKAESLVFGLALDGLPAVRRASWCVRPFERRLRCTLLAVKGSPDSDRQQRFREREALGGLLQRYLEALMDAGTIAALAALVTALAGLLAELRRWRRRGGDDR